VANDETKNGGGKYLKVVPARLSRPGLVSQKRLPAGRVTYRRHIAFSSIHRFQISFHASSAEEQHKKYNPTRTMVLTNDESENDMMMDDVHDNSNGRTEMNLSGAGSSRILQSASLQKQEQMEVSGEGEQPHFPELSAVQASGNKIEYRRVRCPPHRYTPLRESWEQILTPLVEYLKLQVCTGAVL
jgi:hypothetical protein